MVEITESEMNEVQGVGIDEFLLSFFLVFFVSFDDFTNVKVTSHLERGEEFVYRFLSLFQVSVNASDVNFVLKNQLDVGWIHVCF